MPYVSNAGIRIHYEIDGTGPPLVLQHGFTHCILDWYENGYVAALRDKYRLILVDGRGHGISDKPHDEAAYALDRRVADVTAVLDVIGVEKAHFWGYSMGGFVGFGMGKFAPHRVTSLVIGGQHPFARVRTPTRRLICDALPRGRDTVLAALSNGLGPISEAYAARLHASDHDAYAAMSFDEPSMEDVLGTLTMPCCLYIGVKDLGLEQVQTASKRIPNGRFFSLPGLSHLQAFTESSKALPGVLEFLAVSERSVG